MLDHDPGEDWHALTPPPVGILLPAEGGEPAESLAEDQGSGAVAVAAFDEGGAYRPPLRAQGPLKAVDGIVHFDGSEWKREPIEIPTGSEAHFEILAIDATGLGNAWALAEPAEALDRSVVLLQRTSTPEGPLWVERPLSGTPLADADASGSEHRRRHRRSAAPRSRSPSPPTASGST